MKCNLCPRGCNVDRTKEKGRCGVPDEILLARASVHLWEEPPVSGTKGSGTIFFSGCNLGCIYCQNFEISHKAKGKEITADRLKEIFNELESKGVHNINLVNPTHYAHKIRNVLLEAKPGIPVVYNSSGYERVSTLKSLEGLVDIYLPDLKYISSDRSEKYSDAADYFDFATKALTEMKRQCPENIFDGNGIMHRGMIVRHLILPQNTNQSIKILEWIKDNLGTDTIISLMSQYTPCGEADKYKELRRKITPREYEKVVSAAEEMGFTTIFTQDYASASENFIPDFDFSGV
ncbi:MAG: radical SAM protein [Clostridia bacterium]|nr:radical SAM protein [Clostridia bacterium]